MCMYIHIIHMYTCMYIYVYTYMYTYIYVYIYIYATVHPSRKAVKDTPPLRITSGVEKSAGVHSRMKRDQ